MSHISYPLALFLIFMINASITFNMAQVRNRYHAYANRLLTLAILIIFGLTALMIDLYTPYILKLCGIIPTDFKTALAYLIAVIAFLWGGFWGEWRFGSDPAPHDHQLKQRWYSSRHPILFIALLPMAYASLMAALAVWYVEVQMLIKVMVSLLFILLSTLGLRQLYRSLARLLANYRPKLTLDLPSKLIRSLKILSKGIAYILMAILISILSEIYIYSYIAIMHRNDYTPDIFRLFFILVATGLLPYRLIIAFEPPINIINLLIGGIVFSLFVQSAFIAVG